MKKQFTYSERNKRDSIIRYKLWTKILIINLIIQISLLYILPISQFGFDIASELFRLTSTYQIILVNICYYVGVAFGSMMINAYIYRRLIINRD